MVDAVGVEVRESGQTLLPSVREGGQTPLLSAAGPRARFPVSGIEGTRRQARQRRLPRRRPRRRRIRKGGRAVRHMSVWPIECHRPPSRS